VITQGIRQSNGVAVVASMVLAGCAAASPPADDWFAWGFLEAEGSDPSRLFYGIPDTDNIAIGFICEPGSGRATLRFHDEIEGAATLALGSGNHAVSYNLNEAPQHDASVREADVELDQPVIAGFRRTGQLRAVIAGEGTNISARSISERKAVANFWKSCRA